MKVSIIVYLYGGGVHDVARVSGRMCDKTVDWML